jgi:hypothetical protein
MTNEDDKNKPISLKNSPDLNEVLFSWKGPSHPFKKRNRIYFQTIIAMTLLLVAIVFFLNDFLLIGVILAISFLVYAISSVPPIEVEHKITPMGIDDAGRFFKWIDLSSFWFEEKWGQQVLVIQTHLTFPVQIRAVISKESISTIKDMIGKYLLFHSKPVKSFVDKISEWITAKIPLDTTK